MVPESDLRHIVEGCEGAVVHGGWFGVCRLTFVV
jgi:hypothetical protein